MWSDKYVYAVDGIFSVVSERLYWFLIHRYREDDSSLYRYREYTYEDDIPF